MPSGTFFGGPNPICLLLHHIAYVILFQRMDSRAFPPLLPLSAAKRKITRPGKIVPPAAIEPQGSLLGMEKTMPRM